MAKYQIYNGTSWVDICDCTTKVLDSNLVWRELNPRDCPVRYWDGANWCLVECATLICGGSVDLSGADGAYYIPFTIPAGIISITVTVSAFGNPDGFSIVTSDKVTKLASIGLIGEAGANGWNTETGGFPTLNKPVFLYDGVNFIPQMFNETITFYGEGVGDPPGGNPMSNVGGLTMYNPGEGAFPPGTPIPTGLPEPSLCASIDPAAANRCYELTYTRGSAATTEDVLIQIVAGNFISTGWTIFNVECITEV